MMAAVAGRAPHRTRNALQRLLHPLAAGLRPLDRLRGDRVLPGVALFAAVVLILVETPLTAARHLPLPLAFAIVIVHAGAVPAALRRPNLAAPVSLVAVLGLQALSADTNTMLWPWSPVLIVTQCLVLGAVASRTTLPVALVHWLLAVVSSATLAALLRPTRGSETSVDVAVFGSISVALILVALLVTQWRRIRTQLLHERRIAAEESERRVVAEERTRIARELHDVVAHSLSLITVQSSTARFRHREFSEEAAEEFDRIAAQSRQALDEMRGLLRVLRGSDAGSDRRPQPGLQDLPELVAQAGEAGTRITLAEPEGAWSEGVGAVTGLSAFRIVQEAISNALRHAPGSPIAVTLDRVGEQVELVVVNGPGPSPGTGIGSPDDTGHGHGLLGMAERAASVGGRVSSGVTDDGGYAVRASLPANPMAGAAR
jgi:signal transduction histidine kinase